jgi:hypothetical protein
MTGLLAIVLTVVILGLCTIAVVLGLMFDDRAYRLKQALAERDDAVEQLQHAEKALATYRTWADGHIDLSFPTTPDQEM